MMERTHLEVERDRREEINLDLRKLALKHALEVYSENDSEDIISAADEFYKFLKGDG